MKKSITLILSLILLMSTLCCFNINAFALSSSGWCGDNARYTYNSSTGEVVINGSGEIDSETFQDNKNIKSVVINNGITGTAWFAFSNCVNMKSFSVPSSFEYFSLGTLYGCSGLTSITVSSSNKYFDSRNNCNAIIETKSNTLLAGCQTTIIPSTVKSIDNEAFGGITTITSINIPEGVQGIGYCSFMGCKNLTTIYLPRSINFFGCHVFSNSGLKNVYYNGTKAEWSKVYFDGSTSAIIYQTIKCTDGDMKLFRNINWTEKYGTGTIEVANIDVSTYNGKAHKPLPKVRYNGKLLQNGTDYTLSYSNNKNIGKGVITIKGKGLYYGTVKKTFSIGPKGTSIKSARRGSKDTIVWKKQTSRTNGYQVQVSTNKKFEMNTKSKTFSSNKTTSWTVSLSGGAKHYARVRTYKNVNGKKIYSKWSKVKAY